MVPAVEACGHHRSARMPAFEAPTVTLGNLTEGVVRSTVRWLSVQGDLGDPRPPALSARDRLALKGLRAVGAHSGPHIKEARCRFRNRFAGPRPPAPAAPFSPSAGGSTWLVRKTARLA